jgi:hypothetical protein
MKCDMGGAGAILGAARSLMMLQPAGVQVGGSLGGVAASMSAICCCAVCWRDDGGQGNLGRSTNTHDAAASITYVCSCTACWRDGAGLGQCCAQGTGQSLVLAQACWRVGRRMHWLQPAYVFLSHGRGFRLQIRLCDC